MINYVAYDVNKPTLILTALTNADTPNVDSSCNTFSADTPHASIHLMQTHFMQAYT